MVKAKDFGLLYKFNYPPYQVISYSDNSFVVCGGGGAAKTGVPNKIELYEISEINDQNNLTEPILNINLSFDTADKAIMSMRKHFNYLLTAEGNDLCEYIICDKNNTDEIVDEDHEESVVKQRGQIPDKTVDNQECVQMKLHRKISPCFSNIDCEITVVRYLDKAGHLIVVGSNTGVVRVFQRYSDEMPMNLVLQKEFREISESNAPIVELDVSPNLDEIVTICGRPDGKYARVWSISRGMKVTELALTNPKGKKLQIMSCSYKFRHCRYSRSSIARPSFLLYTTHQPITVQKKMSSFMSVWGPLDPSIGTDYQLIDLISLGSNKGSFLSSGSKLVPTALNTSSCGLLAAIGSGEGQVDVYRLHEQTYKLARVYSLSSAHSFFVTDLTFLPTNRSFKGGHQFELLSVGVDNMLRYHRLPHQPTYLRLEKFYKLLPLMLVIFFCDRVLVLLSLFQ